MDICFCIFVYLLVQTGASSVVVLAIADGSHSSVNAEDGLRICTYVLSKLYTSSLSL